MSALAVVPVGVVVERIKAESAWIDYLWRPSAVLPGEPDTRPWTRLGGDGERTSFYAGSAGVEFHPSETGNYRDNLATGAPLLWVVLRPTDGDPPYSLHRVTADPAEGEAMTEAGNDLVETVAMPDSIRDQLAAFVAAHHVEQAFVKRKRDRANPESLGRRTPATPKDDE